MTFKIPSTGSWYKNTPMHIKTYTSHSKKTSLYSFRLLTNKSHILRPQINSSTPNRVAVALVDTPHISLIALPDHHHPQPHSSSSSTGAIFALIKIKQIQRSTCAHRVATLMCVYICGLRFTVSYASLNRIFFVVFIVNTFTLCICLSICESKVYWIYTIPNFLSRRYAKWSLYLYSHGHMFL